jgi:protocatechuate 3,4-dioxygenase beta subunit
LPGVGQFGTPLEVRGVVYTAGGKVPAAGVVLYVYHTNPQGIYPKNGNETGWGKRHGYLRGWLKTNSRGEYKFLTSRPGSYPQSSNPAHIHIFVKEEGLNEYYIDDFNFSDDPLFTTTERAKQRQLGGSGMLTPVLVNGKWMANRDIILGLNIPNYTKE